MSWRSQPRGPDGRWIKTKAGVVAAAAATGIAVASVGAGGGAAGGGAAGSVGSQAVRVKVDAGKTAARTGNRAKTWKNMGLRQLRSRAHNAVDCFRNSYGDVRGFFAANPCRSLNRALFVLSDGSATIVLSVSWVRMPNPATAERLQTLADRHGTGNVSPIALSLLQVSGVEFTGYNYGSRRLGPLVVIAEAEPVTGAPDPAFVDGVAEAAALLPPPRR